jgi:hypothetical protein
MTLTDPFSYINSILAQVSVNARTEQYRLIIITIIKPTSQKVFDTILVCGRLFRPHKRNKASRTAANFQASQYQLA